MTKRVIAKAYIDPRLALTDEEVEKICVAGEIKPGGVEIIETKMIIGSYISKSIVFYKSAMPRGVSNELKRVAGKIRSAQSAIVSLIPASDNSDYIVAKAAGERDPIALTELDKENREKILKENRFSQKADAEIAAIAAGHVLNKVALSNEIDIGGDYYLRVDVKTFHLIMEGMLESIRDSIEKVTSPGGKIGDVNFYPFIAELVNMYCSATGHGPYTAETRKFICVVRDVVRDRFLEMDLGEAVSNVTQSYYVTESTDADANVNGLIRRALNKAGF